MNIFAFCANTVFGAGIWVLVPAGMGHCFGRNEQMVLENLRWFTLILVAGCGVILFFYWHKWQCHSRRNQELSE